MTTSETKNRFLQRRDLLKGLAAIGVLSSAQVQQVYAQSAAPLRVLILPLQHGWGAGNTATSNITGNSETDFTLPNYWQPFNAIKDQCVFVDGLRGTFWGNAHDVSYSDILTAATPINGANSGTGLGGPFPRPVGPSIDYLLEQHYSSSALRLCARYRSFGAAYHPLSFNDRIESLPYYTRARDAYDSVFANMPTGDDTPTTETDAALAEAFRFLDDRTRAALQQVNEDQRSKLLGYQDAVGSLREKLIASTPGNAGAASLRRIPERNQGLGKEIDDFFDMVRVAFTNDSHRVAVLGLGEQNNEFDWTLADGTPLMGHSDFTGDFHHDIAHFNNKGENNQRAYIGWTQYYAQKVVNFVRDLEQTTDVDGNPLIDNTVIVLTGEVANGNHDRFRKPHVVIGGGNRINRGRWLRIPEVPAESLGSRNADGNYMNIVEATSYFRGARVAERGHADLFVRIANLAGLGIDSLGIDSVNRGALEI